MRLLVCGGRDFCDKEWLYRELDAQESISEIIHGGARGADALAGQYAREHKVKETIVRADWKTYGRSAGHIRNGIMAEMRPDRVLVFPGGNGTASMKRIAAAMGIEVVEAKE